MSEAIEFIAYAKRLGLRLRIKAGKLVVSPRENLREGDLEWIRDHKDAIMAAMPNDLGPCPGVCPGACHDLCCGAPDPAIELLFSGGLIAPKWCSEHMDKGAIAWRERWESTWTYFDEKNSPVALDAEP